MFQIKGHNSYSIS